MNLFPNYTIFPVNTPGFPLPCLKPVFPGSIPTLDYSIAANMCSPLLCLCHHHWPVRTTATDQSGPLPLTSQDHRRLTSQDHRHWPVRTTATDQSGPPPLTSQDHCLVRTTATDQSGPLPLTSQDHCHWPVRTSATNLSGPPPLTSQNRWTDKLFQYVYVHFCNSSALRAADFGLRCRAKCFTGCDCWPATDMRAARPKYGHSIGNMLMSWHFRTEA